MKKSSHKTQLTLNGERPTAFPLRIRNRQECLLSPLLFNTIVKFLACAIRQKMNSIQIRKEDAKLFADDMISYTENPEDPTKKLVE